MNASASEISVYMGASVGALLSNECALAWLSRKHFFSWHFSQR